MKKKRDWLSNVLLLLVIEDGQTCKDGCFKHAQVKVCEFYFSVNLQVCPVMKMNEMKVQDALSCQQATWGVRGMAVLPRTQR